MFDSATVPTGKDRSATPDAVSELARAIEQYQRESGRMFPTWSEVLAVARALGYTKPEALQ